jgi:hypothetical protein
VEKENPSECVTVNWKACKSAIALYCLYLSVIKRESVTKVLINPIIPTRTRHSVTRTTLDVTFWCQTLAARIVLNSSAVVTTENT